SGGKFDPAEEMGQKQGLGITLRRMTSSGVPGATASIIMGPGDGMVEAIRPSRVGSFIERSEDVNRTSRIGLEIVPFISPDPSSRKEARRGIDGIDDLNCC